MALTREEIFAFHEEYVGYGYREACVIAQLCRELLSHACYSKVFVFRTEDNRTIAVISESLQAATTKVTGKIGKKINFYHVDTLETDSFMVSGSAITGSKQSPNS